MLKVISIFFVINLDVCEFIFVVSTTLIKMEMNASNFSTFYCGSCRLGLEKRNKSTILLFHPVSKNNKLEQFTGGIIPSRLRTSFSAIFQYNFDFLAFPNNTLGEIFFQFSSRMKIQFRNCLCPISLLFSDTISSITIILPVLYTAKGGIFQTQYVHARRGELSYQRSETLELYYIILYIVLSFYVCA